jgi:hypothetical protein
VVAQLALGGCQSVRTELLVGQHRQETHGVSLLGSRRQRGV